MMTDRDKRLQIESALRRELTEGELVAVPTLDELTLPQLQVVAQLGKRDPISPSLYLQAVVPDARFKARRSFVQDIDAYIAARLPPVERRLDDESLFERTLGRPLSEAERRPVATLDQLSPEHRDAAALMYAVNIDTAIMYIFAIASDVTVMMSEKWIIATFQPRPVVEMEPKIRRQIEDALERKLTNDELTEVETIDDLTSAQLEVATSLKRRNLVTTALFLRFVLRSVPSRDIYDLIDDIENYAAARVPPSERRLHDESLFERTLGRRLSEAERNPIATLDQISPEQQAAAALMYAVNIDTAIMYIVAIASKVTAMMSERWVLATFQPPPPPPA